MNFSGVFFFTFQLFPYLCFVLVFPLPSGRGNKRESGENPGQSRCCELQALRPDNTPATVCYLHDGKAFGQKQVRRPASSSNRLYSRGFRVGHLHIYIYCTVKNTGNETRCTEALNHVATNAQSMPYSFEGSACRILPVFFYIWGRKGTKEKGRNGTDGGKAKWKISALR